MSRRRKAAKLAAKRATKFEQFEQPTRTRVEQTTSENKARLLDALRESFGIIRPACEAADVSVQTYYNYLDSDSEFAAAVKEINERTLDKLESSVVNIALAGEQEKNRLSAAQFLLKTKGKQRGFTEKQETELSGEVGLSGRVEIVAQLPSNGRDKNTGPTPG